jgi:uncharacterized C2H2 Zn-finger protein
MRKLIEMDQQILITCDNPGCDYEILNPTGDPHIETKQFIGKPCPKCGKSLLTEKDYYDHLVFLRTIDWVNKWFSWLTIFNRKSKKAALSIHVHD